MVSQSVYSNISIIYMYGHFLFARGVTSAHVVTKEIDAVPSISWSNKTTAVYRVHEIVGVRRGDKRKGTTKFRQISN